MNQNTISWPTALAAPLSEAVRQGFDGACGGNILGEVAARSVRKDYGTMGEYAGAVFIRGTLIISLAALGVWSGAHEGACMLGVKLGLR